ncbi:MAG: metabolite traffic protein EboE [Planctomycetota bacterium]
MAFSDLPLSYCTNVHPGETFAEACRGLRAFSQPLRRRVNRPIAAGLWMTARAIEQLDLPENVDALTVLLADANLACYTMNAFPLGNFHASRVKENVYLPNWTSSDRMDYTLRVARLLATLLPDGATGSISTSPCAWKLAAPVGGYGVYFPRLIETATSLAELADKTGKVIRLAIEPEPGCVLETTDEAIAFFHELWRSSQGTAVETAVREHLGLCYDVCHQAVEFEDVADSIDRLDREGIRINKVHVTCALELDAPGDMEAREHLSHFAEERYLHQTYARHPDGRILSLPDLTRGFALDPPAEWLECPRWRTHFHVPINRETMGTLRTTRPVLVEALRRVHELPYAPHLEVETYTWDVMPEEDMSSAGEPFDLVAVLAAELESGLKIVQDLKGAAKE